MDSVVKEKHYTLNVRHEVAQEMRRGSSESACRSGLQTTLSCFPQRREVVSVTEKA